MHEVASILGYEDAYMSDEWFEAWVEIVFRGYYEFEATEG